MASTWIDQSATPTLPLPEYAVSSRSKTDDMGHVLADSLIDAGIGDGTNIQLLGHSHGARVATLAAIELENANAQVDQLTLWDSPEQTFLVPDGWYSESFNNLQGLLADYAAASGKLTIGSPPRGQPHGLPGERVPEENQAGTPLPDPSHHTKAAFNHGR